MLDYRPSEISCAAVILAINNRDILIMDEDYDRVVPGVVSRHHALIAPCN